MQSTLTGPTGAAMIRPVAIPRIGSSKFIMALEGGIEEAGRAADPLHSFIVIDAHLAAAAHADDGIHGEQGIEPEVHDAHFDFGGAERGVDHRGEIDTLLEDVLAAFFGGDGGYLSGSGSDDDAGAGERVQGFEDVALG